MARWGTCSSAQDLRCDAPNSWTRKSWILAASSFGSFHAPPGLLHVVACTVVRHTVCNARSPRTTQYLLLASTADHCGRGNWKGRRLLCLMLSGASFQIHHMRQILILLTHLLLRSSRCCIAVSASSSLSYFSATTAVNRCLTPCFSQEFDSTWQQNT